MVESPLLTPKEAEGWMRLALREAEAALAADEVPVGAVIVKGSAVIGRGYNRVEALRDATAHAEILAIGAASEALGDWRLEGTTLYVTLEPCAMCAGAILLARIPCVVFGAYDPRMGACGSVLQLLSGASLDRQPQVLGSVLDAECAGLLRDAFRAMRARAEKRP
jgi:tRNA(adenine34) deaminase